MATNAANRELYAKLMFRLLPAQIFLAAINSINSIISSLFASNFLGEETMSAVTSPSISSSRHSAPCWWVGRPY